MSNDLPSWVESALSVDGLDLSERFQESPLSLDAVADRHIVLVTNRDGQKDARAYSTVKGAWEALRADYAHHHGEELHREPRVQTSAIYTVVKYRWFRETCLAMKEGKQNDAKILDKWGNCVALVRMIPMFKRVVKNG
jgi:hypothetical protein